MYSRAAALLGALTFSIVVLGAAAAALAQTYQGTIRGIVRDQQGIIPGVEVTLVNDATNAARSVMTNEVGEYVLPERAARHLHGARVAGGLQDRRAHGPAARHAADDRAWTSRSRSARSTEQITVQRPGAGGRALDGHAWRRR